MSVIQAKKVLATIFFVRNCESFSYVYAVGKDGFAQCCCEHSHKRSAFGVGWSFEQIDNVSGHCDVYFERT